jgi:hypothetical protein
MPRIVSENKKSTISMKKVKKKGSQSAQLGSRTYVSAFLPASPVAYVNRVSWLFCTNYSGSEFIMPKRDHCIKLQEADSEISTHAIFLF